MTTKKLTQNIDNLTGTSSPDLFDAQLFTTSSGNQTATLQTGDTLNGGGGADRLQATVLADGNGTSVYLGRPKLTSIETVQITSISNTSGAGSDNQSTSTIDFLQSTGVTTFVSDASNNQLNVANAGAISRYVASDSIADDDEDGLVVKGITLTGLSVKASAVSSSGMTTETISLATKSGDALNNVGLTTLSSQFAFDADVSNILTISSGGLGNVVGLADATVNNIIVQGSGDLELFTTNWSDFEIDRKFDASALGHALIVDGNIEGNFSVLRGSKSNDTFNLIDSGYTGAFAINLGQGTNTVAQIVATAATSVNIQSGNGSDTLSSVTAMSGPLTINTSAGSDSVVITGLDATANNNIQMGDNSDVLDVSSITPDLDSSDGFVDTFDGGAGSGSNRFRAELDGLTTDQASHILNFQTLDLVTSSTGAYSADDLSTLNRFIAENGTGTLNFNNLRDNFTLELQGGGFYHADFGDHDTSSNVLNVSVGTTATADNPGNANQGTVAFPDLYLNENGHAVETLNVTSKGGALAPTHDAPAGDFSSSYANAASDYNILRINYQDGTTTINIKGAEDIQVLTNNTTSSALTTVNAGTLTGALDMTGQYVSGDSFIGLQVSMAGAIITGGTGNDFLIGGEGADTFNLSKGGNDTIDFIHQGDSDLAINQVDTVNSFVSGSDKLAFNGTAGPGNVFTAGANNVTTVVDGTTNTGDVSLNFLGDATSFSQAQGAISTFAAGNTQDFGCVFDKSTSTFYLDSNHDGMLNTADMQIQMNGLTAHGIVAADLKIA